MPSAARYAAQKAAAAARGSTPYKDRIQRAAARGVTDRARAEGHVKRKVAATAAKARKRGKGAALKVGGNNVGRVVKTRSFATVISNLRTAAKAGQLVSFRVTIQRSGTFRTVSIDGRNGEQNMVMAEMIAYELQRRETTKRGRPRTSYRRPEPLGWSVEGDIQVIRFDQRSIGGGGLTPENTLLMFAAHRPTRWLDVLAEIAAAGYELNG